MENLYTAIDDTQENHNSYEIDLLRQVKENGWRSTHVSGSDDGSPSFTYTTGFWLSLRRPEIILFDFPPALAHNVLGQIYRILGGGEDLQTNVPLEGILSGETVYFFPVKPEKIAEYLLSSTWFYKNDGFPCLQLVWPDQAGNFPWQSDFDAKLLRLQPDITENGWP